MQFIHLLKNLMEMEVGRMSEIDKNIDKICENREENGIVFA